MKLFFITILSLSYLCLLHAQPAALDSNFGNNGHLELGYSNTLETIYDVVHTPDGKVYYLGNARTRGGGQPEGFIFVLDTDGNALTSFGNQGRIVLPKAYVINQLEVDSEERLVTLGIFDSLYINRFLPNGNLDSAFADNGALRLPFPEGLDTYSALELLLQPDDRILIGYCAGTSSQRRLLLHRFLPDGTQDSTFGENGTVNLGITTVGGTGNCVVRLTDNQEIRVAMSIGNQVALLKFDTQGVLDQSFGTNGIKKVIWFGKPQTLSIDAANGHFWLAGYNGSAPPYSIWVLHCDQLGNKIDAKTMGGNTRYLFVEQTLTQNYADMLVRADSQHWYLTVSQQETLPKTRISVIKLTETLARDSSFGQNGIAEKTTLSNGLGFAGWFNSNGQFVVAGTNNNDLVQWILEPNGTEIQYAEHNVLLGDAHVQHLSIDGEGNVLAGRESFLTWGIDLLKINPLGEVQVDYGNNGVNTFLLPTFPFYHNIQKVNHQNDQKQLVAWGGNGNTYLNRLLPNGLPDTTFNQTGMLLLKYPLDTLETVQISDVLVEDDGKIVIGGALGYRTFLARFLPNGQPDVSFGVNGWAKTTHSNKHEIVTNLIKASNNRYYMGGVSSLFVEKQYIVLSFLDNGQNNPDFGSNGIIEFGAEGSTEYGTRIQELSDNNLLLVGYAFINGQQRICTQHKLSLGGNLVPEFGGAGYNTTSALSFAWSDVPVIEHNNGQLILISTSFLHPVDSVIVIRLVQLNADGSLDLNFGQQGVFDCVVDENINNYIRGAQLTSDGNLYLCGSSTNIDGPSVAKIWKINGSALLSSSQSPKQPAPNISISPNPAHSTLSLSCTSTSNEQASISIVDIRGVEVMRFKLQLQSNRPAEETIAIQHLPVGMYFLHTQTQHAQHTTRFVIQRW